MAKISAQTAAIRSSFRKQAEAHDRSSKIRGNPEYINFASEMRQNDQRYRQERDRLTDDSGKVREGRGEEMKEALREYKRDRINLYWKFGLITDEERDRYLGEI